MTAQQPNIVLITPHDLGTCLGCCAWDPRLKTPCLDALAAAGARFTNHFCTAPFCSPSRGSIMTGKYPHVNGLMGLVNLGWDLPPETTTLPGLLHRAGYETALFGFQHIAADPSRLPYDQISARGNYGCNTVAGLVENFLGERPSPCPRPFFLEIGFAEVHRPYGRLEQLDLRESEVTVPPFLPDTPGVRQDMVMFYENIRRMDLAVGRILAALERAGHDHNTLVVFTTDHGIAFPRAKATLYDPGIRTALLMRHPDTIAPATVAQALTSNVDVLPTILDIAGLMPPDDIDGHSLMPLLKGAATTHRQMIFAEKNTQPGDSKRCIRTNRYKYILNACEGPQLLLPLDIQVTAAAENLPPQSMEPRPPVEFYDLEKDPWEQVNLAGKPHVANSERELAEALQRFMHDTADPLLTGTIPRPEAEAHLLAQASAESAMAGRRRREAELHADYQALKG